MLGCFCNDVFKKKKNQDKAWFPSLNHKVTTIHTISVKDSWKATNQWIGRNLRYFRRKCLKNKWWFYVTLSFVYLKKDYICQRLLVVNWAQIHNQSLGAIFYRGLSLTIVYQGKSRTEPPSLLKRVPAVWTELYKGIPGIIFWPMGRVLSCPIRGAQLYPCLHLYQMTGVAPRLLIGICDSN